MWVIDSYISYFSYIGLFSFVLFLVTKIILGKSVETKGDFFEHQRLAKKKVKWLYVVFVVAIALIFVTSYGILLFMLESINIQDRQDNIEFAKIGGIFLIFIIIIGYFINTSKISRNSINNIAKELNAEELSKKTLVSNEKILLNVVEEMAIASQMPIPRVFVLRNEYCINAMCSGEYLGTYKERFAIFVTQGALDTFDRDELQGVIGHEFSHIFHNDVELNMKLISIIFAMSYVSTIGNVMLRSMSKSRSRDKNKATILIVSIVFIIVGFIGNIFSRMIQSAISRQKEFLADASSVQYTRNPDGIKEALHKIEQNTAKKAYISNENAITYAHMFFLPGFATLFATHPSIKERLKQLKNIRF
mgnify:CR=1 FL=1